MDDRMTAGTLCNRMVVCAERSTGVVQAAQRMRDGHVGCLVVVDETGAGRLAVGILTDRDIVLEVVAKEVDPAGLTVEDVMSSGLVTALAQDSVTSLLQTMRREGLRRLPVTTPDGVLVGIVTLDDLLAVTSEQLRAVALAIEAEQLREPRERP